MSVCCRPQRQSNIERFGRSKFAAFDRPSNGTHQHVERLERNRDRRDARFEIEEDRREHHRVMRSMGKCPCPVFVHAELHVTDSCIGSVGCSEGGGREPLKSFDKKLFDDAVFVAEAIVQTHGGDMGGCADAPNSEGGRTLAGQEFACRGEQQLSHCIKLSSPII